MHAQQISASIMHVAYGVKTITQVLHKPFDRREAEQFWGWNDASRS